MQWKLQADRDGSTHDDLISCFCSQAHCFASLSVWTNVSSVNHSEYEESTSLKKTNTFRLDSELLEHVVLCGHSSHIRGCILTLGRHLPHRWFATPKLRLHLFIWLLVCLIYRPVWHLPWIIACVLPDCCTVILFPSSMCNTQKPATQCFYLTLFSGLSDRAMIRVRRMGSQWEFLLMDYKRNSKLILNLFHSLLCRIQNIQF